MEAQEQPQRRAAGLEPRCTGRGEHPPRVHRVLGAAIITTITLLHVATPGTSKQRQFMLQKSLTIANLSGLLLTMQAVHAARTCANHEFCMFYFI